MDSGGTVGTVRPERQGLAGAVLPLAAVLVPISILALIGWIQWRVVWEDAGWQMRRAADSVAEYGTRTLESYSVAAGRVNDRLRGLPDADIRRNERQLHDELRQIQAELPQSQRTYVVDRSGYVLLASSQYPAPHRADLTGREDFQALAAAASPATHVSRTFKDEFDGRLLFSVSRRRTQTGNPSTPDGFDGVVIVSVSPLVLADGMRRLLSAPGDRMALVRQDGNGISTTSGPRDLGQPLPKVKPESPFYGFIAQGARSALYVSATAMPSATALLALRRIDGFPVYAVSLRARADIVARWWAIMIPQLAIGIPATLGLLLLSLRVSRDQRRLAALNADLQVDRDLNTDRLGRAKRFGLVGTFEFDLRRGTSRRSPEYMSVHGLPAVASVETHADWVRRIHPDDRARAESHLFEALSPASGATDYAQTYRIITPAGEIRWIAARAEITRDATGQAVGLLGAHVDVTPMRTTELALAESDARLRLAQEAAGIGTWECARSAPELRLSRQMAHLLAFDPAAAAQPDVGTALARLHPADRWRVRRDLALAYRCGQFRCEFRILRPDPGGEMQTMWLTARARLSQGGGGADRLMGVAYDVTERKVAEAQAALLAHEVEHRAKNLLTIVSGLLRMSVAETHKAFVDVVQGRIMALARATTLLGQQRWQGADIGELIAQELAPFDAATDAEMPRIAQAGPPVTLSPEQAQPFCMALHELATNAAKYGALSVPDGRLEVRWRIEAGAVCLDWRERGGPTLEGAPRRQGFGSRLMASAFAEQLHGRIEKVWEPEGLVCAVTFPLTGN